MPMPMPMLLLMLMLNMLMDQSKQIFVCHTSGNA